MSRKGFTLIELLVVISIIAVLSSVVLASLNTARTKAAIGAGLQFEANIYHADADQAIGVWDLDECSGTGVSDRTGNGNNGTLMSTAAFSTDTPTGKGCSISLNGSTDYVNVPDSASMTFTGDITMSAWLKPNAEGGGIYRTFLAKRGTGTNYELFLNQSNGALSWYNGTLYISSYIPPLNQWTHVAGVINGTTLTLYANGAAVYSTGIAAVSGLTGNPFTIGKAGAGGGEFYSGLIDSIKVFNKSLTASEVGRLYAAELPKHALAANAAR